LEELEEFLTKAKDHGGDGIKLYFGAYDQEHAPQPMYAGRQTVVTGSYQRKRNCKWNGE
jgi:hypothetical protein